MRDSGAEGRRRVKHLWANFLCQAERNQVSWRERWAEKMKGPEKLARSKKGGESLGWCLLWSGEEWSKLKMKINSEDKRSEKLVRSNKSEKYLGWFLCQAEKDKYNLETSQHSQLGVYAQLVGILAVCYMLYLSSPARFSFVLHITWLRLYRNPYSHLPFQLEGLNPRKLIIYQDQVYKAMPSVYILLV
jgi:hypothetical protein